MRDASRFLPFLLPVLLLAPLALAEDEAPGDEPPALQRGFEDGRFVDQYFGVEYAAPELTKGFSLGGPQVLFSGRCAGGVEVEIEVHEAPREMPAAEWRALLQQAWAQDGQERSDLETGDEPLPWALFVQESLAGFQRHHGYGFYARGFTGFIVHAQVRERSETSGDAIKAALAGLEVDADVKDAFLLCHLASKQSGLPIGDPRTLLAAGGAYNQDRFKNPTLALRALTLARSTAGEQTFDADETWALLQGIGLAQLTAGEREASIATWKAAIAQAEKTSQPGDLASNAWYNLACAYSLLERLDEAFEALKKCVEVGSPEQVAGLTEHAQQDPDLENMRADERWAGAFAGGG